MDRPTSFLFLCVLGLAIVAQFKITGTDVKVGATWCYNGTYASFRSDNVSNIELDYCGKDSTCYMKKLTGLVDDTFDGTVYFASCTPYQLVQNKDCQNTLGCDLPDKFQVGFQFQPTDCTVKCCYENMCNTKRKMFWLDWLKEDSPAANLRKKLKMKREGKQQN